MERSNVGNGGISGKVAASLGILYSIGVIVFFTFFTSLRSGDPDSKISLLRFTYYIYFFNFVAMVLWVSGIAKSKAGFMFAASVLWCIPMVHWMSYMFFLILIFTSNADTSDLYIPYAIILIVATGFFMAFYFILLACYSSMKNSNQTFISEYQPFAGGFDWKVAGYAASLLMLSFNIGITMFCSILPWKLVLFGAIVFCFINCVMTVIWWCGIVNDGRKRMLSSLIFWALFFTIWMIIAISIKSNGSGSNFIYFTSAYFFVVFFLAVMTYISIMKEKISKTRKFNLDYIGASNGNNELNI